MDNGSVNADNEAMKDKYRSYSTLNTLYHETRQEIDLLNKQIYTKDNIIADLKARLGRNEGIYMTMGDESVAIGPSKSLLESLCKEICKLRQKRNDMEFKASRQEEVRRGGETSLRAAGPRFSVSGSLGTKRRGVPTGPICKNRAEL